MADERAKKDAQLRRKDKFVEMVFDTTIFDWRPLGLLSSLVRSGSGMERKVSDVLCRSKAKRSFRRLKDRDPVTGLEEITRHKNRAKRGKI